MKVRTFIDIFENIIPNKLALNFDNVGLLIGDYDKDINGIYLCLDINEKVINKVKKYNINTIISHHPVIFNPINRIVKDNILSKKIMDCISNNINIISYHTNLDIVVNGMNENMVKILNFDYIDIDILDINEWDDKCGIGRIIKLRETLDIKFIIQEIKQKFKIHTLKFVDSGVQKINKICLINGSGNSLIKKCLNRGIDLVITGDITYHTAFEALENGLSLIDMGHFNSENIVYMESMKYFIKKFIKEDINIYFDDILTDVYKYV